MFLVIYLGHFLQWNAITMSCAEENYQNLLDSAGCDGLACLLELTAEKLSRASERLYLNSCGVAPVVDGVELISHPWIMMSDGNVADVPILFGTNADEGAIFTTFPHDGTATQLHEHWLSQGYSEDEIVTLNTLYVDGKTYPDMEFASIYWWAAERSLGDDFMSCPSEHTSQQLGAQQAAGVRTSDVYFYHFEHTPREASVTRHVSELAYVFHQTELTAHQDDEDMADVMCSYWGNFISSKDGNPNEIYLGLSSLPPWEKYSAEIDNVLIIKTMDDVVSTTGLKQSECDFAIPRIDASIRSKFPAGQI